MATITLNYDARNKNAVSYIELMLRLNLAQQIDPAKPKDVFDTVGLREYRAGKYTIINNGRKMSSYATSKILI